MLHPINHDLPGALWCGPAAIAALTGFPTSLIHRLVKIDREVGRAVKGMYPGETWRVLRQLGYSLALEIRRPGLTVRALVDESHRYGMPLLVMTSDHYLVLNEGLYVDNGTGWPVVANVAPARYLDALVETAWAVHKVAEPSIPRDTLAERTATMRKARALARKHGVRIDREAERYWYVWCPELEHDDPFDGDGWVGTEADVLARVERYVECLTTGYLEAVTDPCMMDAA